MARGGITEYHVQRARDALLARGVHPSIDAVRIELGNTGSRTTIHRYLKALETAEGTRLDDEALLSETLRELVATLAARLHAEANDKIAAAEHRHTETLQRVEAERDQHQAALEAAQATATEQHEALANECALHRDAQAALTERTTQTRENAKTIEALEQRLQEKDTMIASLEEKHRHAQESLAHYRDSVKAQRDQDQRQHEQQVQHLQAELRQQHQTAAVKQNEITQLTRDNARLAADMLHQQQTARELKQALQAKDSAHDTLVAQQAKLELQLATAHASEEQLHSRYGEIQQTLATQQTQYRELQVQLEVKSELLQAAQRGATPSKTNDEPPRPKKRR